MHRVAVVLLIMLGACWHAAPDPQPPQATPPPSKPVVVDESHEPVLCYQFDASNPTCKDACPRDAPADWPNCAERTRQLLAVGYACTSAMPWSCTPPPPTPACPPATRCQPIQARVIAIRIDGAAIEVTIAAGSNKGVTTSWKATLADRDRKPVANGAVTILTVSDQTTKGRITATADQVSNNPYVLLEP